MKAKLDVFTKLIFFKENT